MWTKDVYLAAIVNLDGDDGAVVSAGGLVGRIKFRDKRGIYLRNEVSIETGVHIIIVRSANVCGSET